MAHASLLVGGAGLGQRQFADELSALLLCEQPRSATPADLPAACGQCPSCRWLATDSHPDFRCLQPEAAELEEVGEAAEAATAGKGKKPSLMIKLDAVRALEDFVFVGSHRHGRRVILIDPAEAMNFQAANALLKILEEPPATVYFILISDNQRRLLPTIRSRCRALVFQRPDRQQAESWLRGAGADTRAARFLDLANGAPATVLQWQESRLLPALEGLVDSLFRLLKTPGADPLALAAQWDGLLKKEPALTLERLVEAVQRWLFDLAHAQTTGQWRYHASWAPAGRGLSLSSVALTRAWRELLRFRQSAGHPLNTLLFLEDFATLIVRTISSPRSV